MADSTDMQAHVSTYSRMIGMLKWGGLAVFILAGFVIWLLV